MTLKNMNLQDKTIIEKTCKLVLMNTKAKIKGASMKTDEIEVLFEQLLNNYANGNIEK